MSYANSTRDVYPPPGYEFLYPQRRETDVGVYPPQLETRHQSYQAYTSPHHFNPPSYNSTDEDSSLSFLKGCLAGLCCCCLLEKCCF